MIRIRHLYIVLTVTVLFTWSCAKESSPTGGPVDADPPVVLKSIPPDGTVNFNQKSFEITFDEYVVLVGLDQKLLISPPLEKKPEIKIRGKSINVSFNEALRDSVTYTFYFQDAIQDLNENNPINNFQYVFSTGPHVDSLSVTGTIVNAFNLDPLEDIYVVLYKGTSDTLPLTTTPSYVTRASEDGSFIINHLAEGEYSIYGLKDANNNKKYDLADESFAFLDTTIILTSARSYIEPPADSLAIIDTLPHRKVSGSDYKLYLFTAEAKKQYLKGSNRDKAFKMQFVFAMPVDSGLFNISFPGADSIPGYKVETSVKRDTFIVWMTDSLFYNQPIIPVRLVYPAADSTGNIIAFADTIDMRYLAPKPVRGSKVVPREVVKFTSNINPRKGLIPGQKVTFNFETPQAEPDTSSLKLYVKRDTIMVPLGYKLRKDSILLRKYYLDYSFVPDSSYLLIADKNAFKDIFGNTNDSTAIRFKVRNADSFGSLSLNLSGYQGNILLQLLSSDEKIIESRRVSLQGKIMEKFPYLEPGSYRIKVIFDLDDNGAWTPGDFSAKKQPEPVTYYPDEISAKALWTIEQDWELSSMRDKGHLNDKKEKSARAPRTRTSSKSDPSGRGASTNR